MRFFAVKKKYSIKYTEALTGRRSIANGTFTIKREKNSKSL